MCTKPSPPPPRYDWICWWHNSHLKQHRDGMQREGQSTITVAPTQQPLPQHEENKSTTGDYRSRHLHTKHSTQQQYKKSVASKIRHGPQKKAQQRLYHLQWMRRYSLNPLVLRSCTRERILIGAITWWVGGCTTLEHRTLQRVQTARATVFSHDYLQVDYTPGLDHNNKYTWGQFYPTSNMAV